MFNLGGAMKNITAKAEELVEEKKHAATTLLEKQVKETGEFISHTLSEAEGKAVSAADEAKKAAVDGFDQEVEKLADSALQETSKQDIGGGGLLGGIKNSVGHVASQIESGGSHAGLDLGSLIGDTVRGAIASQILPSNVEGTVHGAQQKLEGVASTMTHKIDESVVGKVAHSVGEKVQDVNKKVLEKADGMVHAVKGVSDKMHNAVGGMMSTAQGMVNSLGDLAEGLANGVFGGFIGAKFAVMIVTKFVPVATTLLEQTTKVTGFVFGRVVPKGGPAPATTPAATPAAPEQQTTVGQVASEAKTLVDKTAAELKPALGQAVQDKINPLAQDLAKKLQPITGDVSAQVNTALAEGIKQLNPVVDDVSTKAKGFVDETAKQVSTVVDDKLKEADKMLSDKRDSLGDPAKSMLSKAKGLFGCKLGCCTIM